MVNLRVSGVRVRDRRWTLEHRGGTLNIWPKMPTLHKERGVKNGRTKPDVHNVSQRAPPEENRAAATVKFNLLKMPEV